MEIAAGIWWKHKPTRYEYDPSFRSFDDFHSAVKREAIRRKIPANYDWNIESAARELWEKEGSKLDSSSVRNMLDWLKEAGHVIYDPALIPRGRGRLVRPTIRAARLGYRGARGLVRRVRSHRAAKPRAAPVRVIAPSRRPDPRLYADPARLPKPQDHPGYDNLNNVRLVPEAKAKGYVAVKRLMEGQMVMPQHQWNTLYTKVKDWPDVEVTDEDKDGKPDRLIRRGHKNRQTNLFIDRA